MYGYKVSNPSGVVKKKGGVYETHHFGSCGRGTYGGDVGGYGVSGFRGATDLYVYSAGLCNRD